MTTIATGTKRLVLAATDVTSLVALRSPLIEEAIRRRHKVVVFAPAAEASAVAALERLGASVALMPFEARGFNPIGAYLVRRDLAGHLKAFAPHTLATCDATAALALTTTAKRAGVQRVVAMLPRLPLEGAAADAADKALRVMLAETTAIIVETPEERRTLLSVDWMSDAKPIFVAPTSGIDAQRNPATPLPPLQDGFVFVLVSPGSDQSARNVFKIASDHLAKRAPQARFIIADEADGQVAIHAAHAVVHASTTDGLCQGLLRALAAGRPVITTNVAASRDTVDERVNGCCVAPGDAVALADAMASFLKRTDLIPAMARASRLKAERRFDLTTVNRITLDALGLNDDFTAAA